MKDKRSKVTIGFIRDQRGHVTIQVFGTVYCTAMKREIRNTFHARETDMIVARVVPDFLVSGVVEGVEMADLRYDMCDKMIGS